jgi:hypothetical protein
MWPGRTDKPLNHKKPGTVLQDAKNVTSYIDLTAGSMSAGKEVANLVQWKARVKIQRHETIKPSDTA